MIEALTVIGCFGRKEGLKNLFKPVEACIKVNLQIDEQILGDLRIFICA